MARHRCPVALAAEEDADRIAVVVGDHDVSYGALDARVRAMAQALVARGLAGTRVAVRARASVDTVALHVAAARTGTTLIPLNLRLLPIDQDGLAARARAAAIFDDDDLAALDADADDAASFDAAVIDDEHETVLFTSGTTGLSKGARVPFCALRASSDAACVVVDAEADDTWLMCMPLFHIGGIALMWRSLLTRAHLRLLPVVDVDAIAAFFAAGSVQHASLVPTTLAALLPKLTTVSPRVKAVLIGGGPVPEHLLVEARRRGLPAVWTWGMTETASQAATASPHEPPRAAARPLPGMRARILDDAGHAVAAGVVGNLFIAGPTLFRGYLDDDRDVVDEDGFFATLDLASIDDEGRVAIAARRTDLILSGGENLYPVQIEEVLARCDGVVDVAVVAVDDDTWGQRPWALVVLRGVAAADVEAFAAEALPRLQRPDRIVVVDALPRNAMQKLDRRAARALIAR